MPKSLPPLNALRTFEAAARLGSFTRAARELHVTPAAVSHQIRGLEDYLGTTLFRRTTRALVLTEQARAAAARLRDSFDGIAQGVELLRPGAEGAIRIDTTPAFATRWLVPRLQRFQRQHVGLQLHIVANPAPVDFEQEDVDIAVRVGRGGIEGVVAVELFREWVAPVAAPRLLRSLRLKRPSDLSKAPLLHDDSLRRAGRPLGWQSWLRFAGHQARIGAEGTHYDDGHLALQAASEGAGVALGRLVYAVGDIAHKRLSIVAEPLMRLDLAYYLLIPESKVSLPAVATFQAWMQDEAAAFRLEFAKLVEPQRAETRRRSGSRERQRHDGGHRRMVRSDER